MTFSLAKDIYYATHAHPNDLLDETPVVSRERGGIIKSEEYIE